MKPLIKVFDLFYLIIPWHLLIYIQIEFYHFLINKEVKCETQNKIETDSVSTISANHDTPNILIYNQAAKQNLTENQMQLDKDLTQKWLEHIYAELNKEISQPYDNTI